MLLVSFARRLAAIVAITATLSACQYFDTPDSLVGKAKKAIEKNDVATATIHLKNALQKQPDHAEARFQLGRLAFDARDFASAEKELARALDLKYDIEAAAPLHARALLAIGNPKAVVERYATTELKTPAAAASLGAALGRAFLQTGRIDEATSTFTKAAALDPSNAASRVGLATVKAARGDRGAALADVEAILAAQPKSSEALTLKSDLEFVAGNLDAAKATLLKLVEADPRDLLARIKLASLQMDVNDFGAASTTIEAIKQLAPQSPAVPYLTAMLEFRKQNLAPAREAVQEALKRAPENVQTQLLAGAIDLASANYELAERQLRSVVERAPAQLAARRLLALTYVKLNQPARAQQVLEPALRAAANDASLLAVAGEVAFKNGDFVKSAQLFEQAAALDPNDVAKRTGLALSRFAQGESDKAYADLETAINLDAKGIQADVVLVNVLLRERKFDQALQAASRLEVKQPNNPAVASLQAAVYVTKGDVAKARERFERALAISGTYYPAAAGLAALDNREGKQADAEQRFKLLLAKDAKNADALIALARLRASHKAPPEEVQQLLEKARASNPSLPAAAIALAQYHLDAGAAKKAVNALQESLVQMPDRSDLLTLLALAQVRADEPSQALKTLERVVRTQPDSASAYLKLGELQAQLKDDSAARLNLQKAIGLDNKLLEAHVALAGLELRAGRKTEARNVAIALQRDFPKSPAGLILEGDLYAAEQRWLDAAGVYRKALALGKNSAVAARTYQALARGKPEEAGAFVSAWLKESPQDVTVRMAVGDTELARKNWRGAAEHYRSVVDAQPANAIALNNLAWALHQLTDPQALGYAEKALELAPQSASVMDTLAVILTDAGQLPRAVELSKKAMQRAPANADIRLHAMQALAKSGDKGGAKRLGEEFVVQQSNSPRVADIKALMVTF